MYTYNTLINKNSAKTGLMIRLCRAGLPQLKTKLMTSNKQVLNINIVEVNVSMV